MKMLPLLQLTQPIKPSNGGFNFLGAGIVTLPKGICGCISAFALVILHGLCASAAFASADQVQEQNPVFLIKAEGHVMHRVLKCDLETKDDLIEFLSSVSIEVESVSDKQSDQESDKCEQVLIHWSSNLLIWFAAGFATAVLGPSILRLGKNTGASKKRGAKA